MSKRSRDPRDGKTEVRLSADFEAFLEANRDGRNGAQQAAWRSWPEAVLAEIREVVRRNDAGTANVSNKAMVGRMVQVHGLKCSHNSLLSFVTQGMGRRSWRKA